MATMAALADALSAHDRSSAVDALERMRTELALYPYALEHALMGLGLQTPFEYCQQMLIGMLRTERSYDSLPNFTAADCVRLLRVGRNEYIATSNRRGVQGGQRVPSRAPLDLPLEHWWLIHARVSLDDLRADPLPAALAGCTDDELGALEVLIGAGCKQAGEISWAAVHSLYARGALYLSVPIAPADRISVPPLQGFVMNRTGDDPIEQTLYQVWPKP
jgi:hypothetical protein